MHSDARGLELSTRSAEAAGALSAALEHYLGLKNDIGALVKQALSSDPEFMFGHVVRGYLMLHMRSSAVLPEASKSLARAEALAGGAGDREHMHLEGLRAWIDGDMAAMNRRLETLLARYPLDLFALKMAQFNYFWQGDRANMRDVVQRARTGWGEQVPGYGFLLGMHAFGLEECGQYREAERAGRRAIELNPADHWGAHAVAHVLEMEGRQREGIAWLDGLQGHWGDGNEFINHLWWHRALFHLELEQHDTVLALYDDVIRRERSDFYINLQNAISLLWRLELRGLNVGPRWEELAELAVARNGDHSLPFTDMHYAIALAAAGRRDDLVSFLASLRSEAAQRPGSWAPVYREVTLPLCEALADFRAGRYEAALAGMQRVRAQLHRAGGSHAQRDVVEQTLVVAALQAGRHDLARTLLAERTAAKPASAWGWERYGEALEALADADGAAAAGARARALLSA